jgi:hypothetical protein
MLLLIVNFNFTKHVANMCLSINRKLYCLKRLIFISFKVKLQFFKTVILAYFDYCSTLSIYFAKTILLKLFNCFYFCLFKLFKWNFDKIQSISDINDFLLKFNLFSFQHRCFHRISMFIFKVYFYQKSNFLFQFIYDNAQLPSILRLRSQVIHLDLIRVPYNQHKFGLATFDYFSASFINTFFPEIPLRKKVFHNYVYIKIKFLYLKFCEKFPNLIYRLNVSLLKNDNINSFLFLFCFYFLVFKRSCNFWVLLKFVVASASLVCFNK